MDCWWVRILVVVSKSIPTVLLALIGHTIEGESRAEDATKVQPYCYQRDLVRHRVVLTAAVDLGHGERVRNLRSVVL